MNETDSRTSKSKDIPIDDLLQDNPWTARVLLEAGLDPFRDSDRTLGDVCEASDVEIRDVERELRAIDRRDDASTPIQFSNRTELVDYLEEHHHGLLRDELPSLVSFANSLRDDLGEVRRELDIIVEQLEILHRDLPSHLEREESLLFPAVRATEENAAPDAAPDPESARDLLVGLEEDHDNYEKSLWQIRDVTDNYALPDDGLDERLTARYANLLARLESLERDLQMHLHRENNVLFRDVRRQM